MGGKNFSHWTKPVTNDDTNVNSKILCQTWTGPAAARLCQNRCITFHSNRLWKNCLVKHFLFYYLKMFQHENIFFDILKMLMQSFHHLQSQEVHMFSVSPVTAEATLLISLSSCSGSVLRYPSAEYCCNLNHVFFMQTLLQPSQFYRYSATIVVVVAEGHLQHIIWA